MIRKLNQWQEKAAPEESKVEYTVSQELLWLYHGDSSETQEWERLPSEASIRGLEKGQQTKRTLCVCNEVQTVRTSDGARLYIHSDYLSLLGPTE
jgi:hypothetical protein